MTDRSSDHPEIVIEPDSESTRGADSTAGANRALEADSADRSTGYHSLALRDIPSPDYCDVVIVPTRGVHETDPRAWAEAIFSHDNATIASRGASALRNEAIRLFDLVPPPARQRDVLEVQGSEALVRDDTPSLMIRIGVAVEPGAKLLRITTAVKYRTIRGRFTWAPRRLTHASAIHTLARRAPVTLRRRTVEAAGRRSGLLGMSRMPKRLEAGRSGSEPRRHG